MSDLSQSVRQSDLVKPTYSNLKSATSTFKTLDSQATKRSQSVNLKDSGNLGIPLYTKKRIWMCNLFHLFKQIYDLIESLTLKNFTDDILWGVKSEKLQTYCRPYYGYQKLVLCFVGMYYTRSYFSYLQIESYVQCSMQGWHFEWPAHRSKLVKIEIQLTGKAG